MRWSIIFLLLLPLAAQAQNNDTLIPYPLIAWTDDVLGDFSFKDKWSYRENVFTNDFGQLVCDGFCEERMDGMRDKSGRIIPDSLTVYYSLLDTTHYYHTLQSESSCSEFLDANYMDVIKTDSGYIYCHSWANVATHCTIEILFNEKTIHVSSQLNSVVQDGDALYRCFNGVLRLDKKEFAKGILKAEFYFTLINAKDENEAIYWKGLIYSPIKQ